MRILILLLVFAAPVLAQTDYMGPPLTVERAEAYVDCYKDLLKLARENSDGIEGKSYEDLDPDDLNAAVAALTTSSALEEFMSIIESHGFENMYEWGQTSQRFLAAYTALQADAGEDDMTAEIEKSIAQIRANDKFSEEQKTEMIEMLRQGEGVMRALQENATDEDKNAVSAVKHDFDQLVEAYRQ